MIRDPTDTPAVPGGLPFDATQIQFTQAGTGAISRTVQDKEREWISVLDFMSDAIKAAIIAGTNTTDVSSQVQAAINTGRPVHCPYAGPYIIGTALTYTTTSSSAYTQGLQIYGDGEEKTVFDNRVANGFMLSIDTNTTSKFQQGVRLEGFKITTTTSPVVSGGISLRRASRVDLKHVKIQGLTGDGVRIVVNEGDGDGSHVVQLTECHIDTCAAWGVNCLMSASRNELSFLVLNGTYITTCGTASGAATPPSGGMTWRGQVLHLTDGAFVTNENVGLYVPGGAGLANTLRMDNWDFENNKKKHCLIEGLDNGSFKNIQLYSNDSFIATAGIYMDGASSTIRNILIDGVMVRATSNNNPYTAFTTTGASALADTIDVKNVSWSDFDHAGQTRYSGNLLRDEARTWTPSLGGTTTYATQSGRFMKDRNRLITFQGQISVTLIGTGSTTTISGLPDSNGSPTPTPVIIDVNTGSATAIVSAYGEIAAGASTIVITSRVAAAVSEGASAIFANGTVVRFSGTYLATAN